MLHRIQILKAYLLSLIVWLFEEQKPNGVRLYFDDEREAPSGWQVVRPIWMQDFIENILNDEVFRSKIEAISFDHDLGEGFHSGYDYFVQLEEAYYTRGIIPPMLYVHSMNPSGRGNILRGIESLNRRLGRSYSPQVLPE